MDSNQDQNLFEKVARLLRQQKEMYGDFEITVEDKSSEINESQSAAKIELHSTASKPNVEYHEKREGSIADELAACSTLEELRSFCERAKVLRTDLSGTNLVFGVGNANADLMLIGEAPGENEDSQGEPFVGKAGQLLDKIMEAIDFKRADIYITNILKHRPPDNRDPKPEEREQSLPFLLKQIELVNPKLILCVGKISATTLLGKNSTLKEMRQQFHEFHGRELVVTYHPAALLRNPHWKRPTWEDVQKLKARYNELGGKP